MASKSLTHIFIIMRDKAIQRRNVYQKEEDYSDRDSLIKNESMEMGVSPSSMHLPPWAAQVEETLFNISMLRDKMKKLSSLQKNLIRCPSLDDNTDEERQLSTLVSEIRMLLERCQKLILEVKREKCYGREDLLNKNIVRAMANSLEENKNDFINNCSSYATAMNNIKKKSSFFDDNEHESEIIDGMSSSERNWNQQQLMFLDDNSLMAQERDRAMQNILKSTLDLNQLFRDVGQLVQEQGTLVDRIDFNVEQSSGKVEEGAKHLRKAEMHQRKNRKMTCIIGLAVAIVFFIFLILLFKS